MVLALGAGKLFKLDSGGEYEETIIGELSTARSSPHSFANRLYQCS